jgi:thiopurine S-methyltransferase
MVTETQALEDQQPWQQRWHMQKTGWDLGGPHPLLATLLERARLEGELRPQARVYVPGCGRAHEAAFAAQQGYAVMATDFVPAAIDQARQLYGDLEALTLQVEDALVDPAAAVYDLIIDRAMLCALAPVNRIAYVQACYDRLAPGGLFAGILFAKVGIERDAGPPFACTEAELWDLFRPRFNLVTLESRPAVGPAVIEAEWLGIWRKPDKGEPSGKGAL